MIKVEFRVLQLILSHVADDRLSVALLHMSEGKLQVAWSLDRLAMCEPAQRDVVRASVKALVRRAEKLARELRSVPLLDTGLQHLFPVREGLGGALYWTPVATVETTNPAAHFEELRRALQLRQPHAVAKRRFGSKALRRRLVALGESLKTRDPDHVKIDETIAFRKAYRSPLSWKNGIWHHTLPFSLDGLGPERIEAEVQRMVGLAELALPQTDVPVIVAVLPDEVETRKRTLREAQLVKEALASRHCEVLEASLRGREIDLDGLLARVEGDLNAHRR